MSDAHLPQSERRYLKEDGEAKELMNAAKTAIEAHAETPSIFEKDDAKLEGTLVSRSEDTKEEQKSTGDEETTLASENEKAVQFLMAIPSAVSGLPKVKQMAIMRALPGVLKGKIPDEAITMLQDKIVQNLEQNEQIERAKEVVKAARKAGDLRKACVVCKKTGPVKPCVRCSAVCYCNKKCQKAHWKVHKKECGNLAQATESTSVAHPNVLKAYDDLENVCNEVKAGLKTWGHEDTTAAIFKYKNTMKIHSIPQALQDGMFTNATGLPLSGIRQSRDERDEYLTPRQHEMAVEMQNTAMAKLGLHEASEAHAQLDRAFMTADSSGTVHLTPYTIQYTLHHTLHLTPYTLHHRDC
jgi:hypothetical protein